MTYVVVGASAGLGRTLATQLAAAGHDLVIVSSDARDIAATAADLSIRYERRVAPVAADVTNVNAYLVSLRAAIEAVGAVDGFLFPLGAVLEDDDGRLGPSEAEWLMRVNFTSVAATVAAFLPALIGRPAAVLIGFGSIAAARGRGRNVVYAAAKRALAGFFESLRHAYAGSGVTVQFYVVGYLDTNLAFGQRTLFSRGDPAALSGRVIRNLGRDIGVVYHPRVWRWLCLGLGVLPWPMFKRLKF